MSDDHLALITILISWKTPSDVLNVFKGKKTTLSTLKSMTTEQIGIEFFNDIKIVKYLDNFVSALNSLKNEQNIIDRVDQYNDGEIGASEALALLQNTSKHLSRQEVMILWNETKLERKKIYLASNIPLFRIFDEIYYLQEDYLPSLLELDYFFIFNEEARNIFSKWPLFVKKITKFLGSSNILTKVSKIVKQLKLVKASNDIPEMLTGDSGAILHLFVALFHIGSIETSISGTKTKKLPTEQAASFLKFYNGPNHFECHITKERQTAEDLRRTIQPSIHVIGSICDIKAVFVTIDKNKYRVDSIIDAIHLVYLTCNVFNVSYQPECAYLWLFVQAYFYDRIYSYDCLPNNMDRFIKDLDNVSA